MKLQIVGLYQDPHGEKIFEDPIERTKSILDASYNAESDKTITMLKRKVTQLERQLTESKINLHARSAEVLDVGSDTDTPREISLNIHGSVEILDTGSDTPEVKVNSEADDGHVVQTDI